MIPGRPTFQELSPLVPLGRGAVENVRSDTPVVYVPSGLKPLDDLILGAVEGEIVLLAGYTGQGKTSLAIQWAEHNAESGNKSAVLSLEMSREVIRDRVISGVTGIDTKILRTKLWENAAQKKLALQAAEWIEKLPIEVDARGMINGERAYNAIMTWRKRGFNFGIVDFIQLMSGKNESRVTQVGDAVRAVKAAAKDSKIPLLVLSSLNRTAIAPKALPSLGWLRDTGDLEFTADTVLMLYYPRAEVDLNDDVREVDIHVLKQRNGPTGVASVRFRRSATRFEVAE